MNSFVSSVPGNMEGSEQHGSLQEICDVSQQSSMGKCCTLLDAFLHHPDSGPFQIFWNLIQSGFSQHLLKNHTVHEHFYSSQMLEWNWNANFQPASTQYHVLSRVK